MTDVLAELDYMDIIRVYVTEDGVERLVLETTSRVLANMVANEYEVTYPEYKVRID